MKKYNYYSWFIKKYDIMPKWIQFCIRFVMQWTHGEGIAGNIMEDVMNFRWKCTVCGSKYEPCIFMNPATKEQPSSCPLNIEIPKWVKE